jgi:hypothetical protein
MNAVTALHPPVVKDAVRIQMGTRFHHLQIRTLSTMDYQNGATRRNDRWTIKIPGCTALAATWRVDS